MWLWRVACGVRRGHGAHLDHVGVVAAEERARRLAVAHRRRRVLGRRRQVSDLDEAGEAVEGVHHHLLIAPDVHLVGAQLVVHELDDLLDLLLLEVLGGHRRQALHRVDAQRVVGVGKHRKDDPVAAVLVEVIGDRARDLGDIVSRLHVPSHPTARGAVFRLDGVGGHHAHQRSEHAADVRVIDALDGRG